MHYHTDMIPRGMAFINQSVAWAKQVSNISKEHFILLKASKPMQACLPYNRSNLFVPPPQPDISVHTTLNVNMVNNITNLNAEHRIQLFSNSFPCGFLSA